ncbi:hypothetical protein TBR22_A44990 [Luteitalea sp. TBR-22]|uniref:hypothetical protein n=1 Tax=Luteitalea sp. TBR-22 TaxID=2802971 RepID=UPI001AF78BEE|nr:hypothetical protein [Luteitalea sp. TBR-22]BCS35272.1 hypothetical protein TBR22_A44990 [Luteitalea sp. TBR-22]
MATVLVLATTRDPDGSVNRDVRIASESGFEYTQPIAGDFSWFDGDDGGPPAGP